MNVKDSFSAAFNDYKNSRRESSKWAPAFVLCALLCIGAGFIKSAMVKGADLLGGKATVERFFRANLVRLIITCVIFLLFLLFFIKTWNGMKSSVEQLIYTAACGLFVVICAINSLLPVVKISQELKAPRETEVKSYTLCSDNKGNYYVGFDDDGGVLLTIPKDKYDELSAGNISDNAAGFAYDEIVESGKYNNVVFYRSKALIVYYHRSVIYENVSLAAD